MSGVLFNGKYIRIPQAATKVDTSAMVLPAGFTTMPIAIIGEATGLLKPKTLYSFKSFSSAAVWIKDGSELRNAVRFAFNPTTDEGLRGAYEIYVICPNPATQGTITKTAGDGNIVFTSYGYGLYVNQINVALADGTNTGKKVTITYQDDTETFDDIEKESLTIQYVGSGTAVTLDIAYSGSDYKLTTTVDASGDLDLNLADFSSIYDLVQYINGQADYTCSVVSKTAQKDSPLNLDKQTALDIKTSAQTINSDLQAIIDEINSKSAYIYIDKGSQADEVPSNFTAEPLTGGTNGTTTNNDWQDALDALLKKDIPVIVPLTTDSIVLALVETHVDNASTIYKKERRMVIGTRDIQTGWDVAVTRATNISNLKSDSKSYNNERVLNVGIGFKQYDENNNLTWYSSKYMACLYAGISGGQSPVHPLTRDHLNVLELEVDFTIEETEDLISNAVAIPIADTENGEGYWVAQQVTTYLQDPDNMARVEWSMGLGADYIAKKIRLRHENRIGDEGDFDGFASIKNDVNIELYYAKRDGIILDYNKDKTIIEVDNDKVYVEYEAQLVKPINYIFNTIHITPSVFTFEL